MENTSELETQFIKKQIEEAGLTGIAFEEVPVE